ncbi:unnamed protein product [Phytophthora lilii]|uniref:Unnamed protein product n=1 Tax=Phytophthora lilii TaxID=2077276 RepID=A0A9W6TAL0_9STRA|nr:unnamed protein product [Phytophthora lilii]
MPRGFESFDRENPPGSSPPGLPVKKITSFLGATFMVAVLLLVLTSGLEDQSRVVFEVDNLNAPTTTTVISPLSFGTMTMYWDQRNATSEVVQLNARENGLSDLELVQIQQVSRHGSR